MTADDPIAQGSRGHFDHAKGASMPETTSPSANAAQIDYWNAEAGRTWVELQAQIDRTIEPFDREGMRALAPRQGERIIDIGCGCGQTTVELAAQVGPSGAAIGVDISAPMLEVARHRAVPSGAARPEFRQIDAQTGDLGEQAFDAMFSRFGVMFFSDPPAAFANIRKALRPSGRLTFVCWRPLTENHWMRVPMEAARPLLPPMPPADPTAPGPLAFADPDRVRAILAKGGFRAVTIDPFDASIGSPDIDQALDMALRMGPLGRALREHPGRTADITDAVRHALSQYETPSGVKLPAAIWVVRAQAG
ncbi:MAG: methyltransferase domain-containing protein [Alphaproteobacteria bacterium]|nr:methyltransferase domain-containing protein [Alphaproteobacteria bacterium]